MAFQRAIDRHDPADYRFAPEPAQAQLRRLVAAALRQHHIDATEPAVAARLARVRAALDQVAVMTVEEWPAWAVEPERGYTLVWAEPVLNHGPGMPAVALAPGWVLRTRPDLLGLRRAGDGCCQAVVRDYKVRSAVVAPAFDDAILARALWMLDEIRQPRCPWFLAGRALRVDATAVTVEAVNLLQDADGPDLVRRAVLSATQLDAERGRLQQVMAEREATLAAPAADAVPASPGPLCASSCPYLGRCAAGRHYVTKYQGPEALRERLARPCLAAEE